MLNAATKCVVDMAGEPVAVQQMTNRQLRVELQLRQHPVSGNKADLCRRLTLAREGKSAQHVKAILAGPRMVRLGGGEEGWGKEGSLTMISLPAKHSACRMHNVYPPTYTPPALPKLSRQLSCATTSCG